MKTASLITLFVVLAGVFCGGKSGSQVPVTTEKWPAEVTNPLTENDVARLVKVLPVLDAALKADSWIPTRPKEGDGPVAALTGYVESMNLPGVGDSLKKAGSSWEEVRPALCRAFAATTALSYDRTTPELAEQIAQMRKDTSSAIKKAVQGYDAFKAVYSQIPAGNKKMFADHEKELQFLYTLGR